jgi:hypothetical protein
MTNTPHTRTRTQHGVGSNPPEKPTPLDVHVLARQHTGCLPVALGCTHLPSSRHQTTTNPDAHALHSTLRRCRCMTAIHPPLRCEPITGFCTRNTNNKPQHDIQSPAFAVPHNPNLCQAALPHPSAPHPAAAASQRTSDLQRCRKAQLPLHTTYSTGALYSAVLPSSHWQPPIQKLQKEQQLLLPHSDCCQPLCWQAVGAFANSTAAVLLPLSQSAPPARCFSSKPQLPVQTAQQQLLLLPLPHSVPPADLFPQAPAAVQTAQQPQQQLLLPHSAPPASSLAARRWPSCASAWLQ